MLDQSCSDGCAILGYGMLLGLKSGWRRSLHWLSQMSQQRLPSNLVCWSSATWPNKKGRIEKMIMEFMKHVWTIWLFEWEGMFIWFIYLIIWVIIWNMQFKAWNWSYAAMLMPSFGVMDHQPSWMTQATTACKESWSVAMHLFEAARKGVMAKMSEILGYGWGTVMLWWDFEVSRSSRTLFWQKLSQSASRPACGCDQLRWWHCYQSNVAKGTLLAGPNAKIATAIQCSSALTRRW